MSTLVAKRGSPERSVQVTLRWWLELVLPAGTLIFATKNEAAARSTTPVARARFHLKRRAEGVVTGFPDLGVLLANGRTLWIEVKAPNTGVLSDHQVGVHDRLRTLGHPVIVATSIETARGALIGLGVRLSEADNQPTAVAKVRVAKPRKRILDEAVSLP